MPLRLEPHDEYMHDDEGEATFNESMYFNVYDPAARLGGFFRLGNRPNEGHAEMTLCLYLPDGRVAFMFDRPKIGSNEGFGAGGMRFEVVRPFDELRVSFDGKAVLLDDPLAMADPKAAFTSNPWTTVSASLTFTGTSPMYGGEPTGRREAAGEEFAKGHYEQLMHGVGSVAVGSVEADGAGPVAVAVDGFGLRDHSWGPRTWQVVRTLLTEVKVFWAAHRWTAEFGPRVAMTPSSRPRGERDRIPMRSVEQGPRTAGRVRRRIRGQRRPLAVGAVKRRGRIREGRSVRGTVAVGRTAGHSLGRWSAPVGNSDPS